MQPPCNIHETVIGWPAREHKTLMHGRDPESYPRRTSLRRASLQTGRQGRERKRFTSRETKRDVGLNYSGFFRWVLEEWQCAHIFVGSCIMEEGETGYEPGRLVYPWTGVSWSKDFEFELNIYLRTGYQIYFRIIRNYFTVMFLMTFEFKVIVLFIVCDNVLVNTRQIIVLDLEQRNFALHLVTEKF